MDFLAEPEENSQHDQKILAITIFDAVVSNEIERLQSLSLEELRTPLTFSKIQSIHKVDSYCIRRRFLCFPEVKCPVVSGRCLCICAEVFERSAYTSIKEDEKRSVIRECLQKGHCDHYESLVGSVYFYDDEILVPVFEPCMTSHPSMNALHLAVLCDNIEIAKWLLQTGSLKADAPTAFFGDSPLHLAVLRRNLDMVKLLVCYKYDVDLCSEQTGQTPALLATLLGERDLLEFLIRCGANVNRAPHNHRPPIFHAVQREHLPCLQLLVESGASQVLPKYCAHNLLMMAMPQVDFLKALLQGGDAQVNEEQERQIYGFKYTPLLYTLRHSQSPHFRALQTDHHVRFDMSV